jgi:L,D-transpeptidase catalytic domain
MLLSLRVFLIIAFSFTLPGPVSSIEGDDADIHQLWVACRLEKVLPFEVFNSAIVHYRLMEGIRKKDLLTIIDFSKPSTAERFFVIDLQKKELLYMCLVAHGKNSGENIANSFSNEPQSLKSSLGLYLTAETYSGKHGYSLRLDGMEANINDNARVREIVIHGADYVSREFIKKYGRLGRSWGCPALPAEISKEVIGKIKGGSCLFIFGRNKS